MRHWRSRGAQSGLLRADGGRQSSNRDMASWHADWAWSLPLIVLNVVIHVLALGRINDRLVRRVNNEVSPRRLTASFVAVVPQQH